MPITYNIDLIDYKMKCLVMLIEVFFIGDDIIQYLIGPREVILRKRDEVLWLGCISRSKVKVQLVPSNKTPYFRVQMGRILVHFPELTTKTHNMLCKKMYHMGSSTLTHTFVKQASTSVYM